MAIIKGKFTAQTNGRFPVDAETFQQLQDYIDGVAELANMYIGQGMNGAILSGCELMASGTQRNPGWLVLADIGLVPFEGGLVADGFSVLQEDVDVVASGVTYPAYTKLRAVAGRHNGAVTYYDWVDIATKENLYDSKEMLPVGSIVLWGGERNKLAGGRWLLCDGTHVLQSAYPELYQAIGQLYNGGQMVAGSFRLPSLKTTIYTNTNTYVERYYIIRAK